MRCSGSSLRKLPARTDSTSWHSAGEALSIATARGRLLPVAIVMIFVPFPRRVGPMARPPFLRSRRWHRRTLRPNPTVHVPANGAPEHAAPLPVSRFSPIAEIAGDMSGTADISLAALAIARRFPTPIKLHSAPLACHATAAHGYPRAALGGGLAPMLPTVYHSNPICRA
jgi:hypothetical protein